MGRDFYGRYNRSVWVVTFTVSFFLLICSILSPEGYKQTPVYRGRASSYGDEQTQK